MQFVGDLKRRGSSFVSPLLLIQSIDASIRSALGVVNGIIISLEAAKEKFELVFDFLSKLQQYICNAIPQRFLSGPCWVSGVVFLSKAKFFKTVLVATIIILKSTVAALTKQVLDYGKSNYYIAWSRDLWMTKSMSIINTNMHDQHLAMRSQLQKRHQDIL